jgi:aspartokinase
MAMKSTAEEIWKIIDNNTCIRTDLSKGLINSRALAKYILKEKKLDTTLDAIISAIRRYQPKEQTTISTASCSKILNKAIISTKSSLANIALIKDAEVQNLLPKIFSVVYYNRGDVLRIIQADESMKILVDEKNLSKIEKLFPEDKIIKIDKNLAEINMHLHPEAVTTPGLASIITNELSINGINIMEIISCVPELLFFVDEKDILNAHQVLYKLCHP